MSGYIVFGTARSRITLYQTDGTTPKYRITLQKEGREGLTIAYKPEGVGHQLGSAANWRKTWTHRLFRASLDLRWPVGVESTLETWASGAWGAPTTILTATALSYIFTWGLQSPCLVEPHLDKAYSFEAQPDPGKALELKDVKGVAHTGLQVVLVACEVAAIPDWVAL